MTAIKDICETFVAYLESNLIKDQNKKTKNTLSGNSNLFEWTWPGEGSMAEWIEFSPVQIANLQKKQIEIPEPVVLIHTTPKNKWIVAIPNVSDISENQDQNVIWNFFHEFSLESGWALKSKQKYGKKGGEKRNVNKSKRFTAATMLENPRRKVEEEELDKKEIPKLQTI
ncbi:8683_t:CDS:2 [Rhizophagus irregularis]|nr:8683_t:CDS:2 [Rhizophagus irregularis]